MQAGEYCVTVSCIVALEVWQCVAVVELFTRCVNRHTRINMMSQLTSYVIKSMPSCLKDPIVYSCKPRISVGRLGVIIVLT